MLKLTNIIHRTKNIWTNQNVIKNTFTSSILTKKDNALDDNNKITCDEISDNEGLSQFIGNTYKYTGLGVVSTLGISQLLTMPSMTHILGSPHEMILPMLGGGFLLSIASIFGIHSSKYEFKTDNGILKSVNSPARIMSYAGLITGMSMTITPMVGIMNDISTTIMPTSVLFTSLIFGSGIMYAKYKPVGSLLKYQAPLFAGLTGLVGMGVIGIGAHYFMGPNLLSEALYNVDTYGGIALFTAMTAYDTQLAIDMYKKKNPDHLGCSVALYLDFMNLLIRIMKIVAESKRHK
jgi:FtsH-binding integral membrane protein